MGWHKLGLLCKWDGHDGTKDHITCKLQIINVICTGLRHWSLWTLWSRIPSPHSISETSINQVTLIFTVLPCRYLFDIINIVSSHSIHTPMQFCWAYKSAHCLAFLCVKCFLLNTGSCHRVRAIVSIEHDLEMKFNLSLTGYPTLWTDRL